MSVKINCVVVIVTLFIKCSESISLWSFNETSGNGPSSWSNSFPACEGLLQNPININVLAIKFDTDTAAKINIQGFKKMPKKVSYSNNGHSPVIKLGYGKVVKPYITFQPYAPKKFWFEDLRIRWPSDHTINGVQYDGELQLKFKVDNFPRVFNPDHHKTIIWSILLDTSETESSETQNWLFKDIKKILKKGSSYDSSIRFTLYNLLESTNTARDSFPAFGFSGSETEPPCLEEVLWLVYPSILKVSPKAFEILKQMKDIDGNQMSSNNRPIQRRNKRPITYYYSYT